MSVALVARVVRGLEWVAADEIDALAPFAVTLTARQVSFVLADLSPAAAALRCVDDLFVRVGRVDGIGPHRGAPLALARGAARLDVAGALASVAALRSVPRRPAFDVVASVSGDHRYSRTEVEDAIGEELAAAIGGPYRSRRDGAAPPPCPVSLRVIVEDGSADVLVRVAARPLHRRPWKQDTAQGTLHPPAAAALLRMAGPTGTVVDPFCGDGTIAIEAAVQSAIDPATGRPGRRCAGSDLDADRLANAAANAARAGVEVALARADATAGPWRVGDHATWVTNPPWNRTVAGAGGVSGTLDPAWREAALALGPTGTVALIADAGIDVTAPLTCAGWQPAVTQQVRLVGRLCQLLVAVPIPGGDAGGRSPLSASLWAWRARSMEAGVTTDTGF